MKIVYWFVRYLSGDDSYPISCEEWLVEQKFARSWRSSATRWEHRHYDWR